VELSQPIPRDYLPPQDALPRIVGCDYPAELNVCVELVDGALQRGWGELPAFWCEGQALTYAQLARRVNRLANGFRRLRVGLGDRVMLRLHDGPDLAAAMLALFRIGAVAIPTYTLFRAPDLTYRANDAEAVGIVAAPDLLAEVREAEAGCPTWRWLADDLDELAAGQPDDCPPAATRRDDVAMLLYTSGTTSDPKGVIQTHAEHFANTDRCLASILPLRPGDVLAGPMALPFAFGVNWVFTAVLRTGSASVLFPRKTPELLLEAVERHRVKVLAAVPTFCSMMLQLLEGGRGFDLSSVRNCFSGGEPLPMAVFDRWKAVTGLDVWQALGATEIHGFMTGVRAKGLRPETCGQAIDGYQIAIRDVDSFAELPPGEAGIFTCLGPSGARYWRKPDLQRRTVRDGWTIINDVVTMDADGYVSHVGRSDDVIVSGGYNISPSHVETVIGHHPAVHEVAVVAAPDPSGQRPAIVKAYVVTRAGSLPSDDLVADIQRFVRERTAPYMYPRAVEFVADLPKTPNGKVRRSELKQAAWEAGA
jgi:2-aminobenzoate-CoA ligase